MPSATARDTERLLSLREVRQLLGVSKMTVHRLVAGGGLAVVRIGTRTLVEPDDLRALIARHRVANDSDPAGTGPLVTTPVDAGDGDDPG
jgi:excisionase family DNA binding protein